MWEGLLRFHRLAIHGTPYCHPPFLTDTDDIIEGEKKTPVGSTTYLGHTLRERKRKREKKKEALDN